MKAYNWNLPQRQPLAGLGVVILETLGEAARRLWPFIILMLFTNKKGRFDTYDLIALLVLAMTIFGAFVRYFFFRFSIEDEKLIIRSGWAHKETGIIPLQRIQSVEIAQGPLHQLFGIVKLTVDTAGSTRTEVKIDALHRPMAEALRTLLLSQRAAQTEEEKVTLPAEEPVLMQLQGTDLLRLSISANHLEAFFLLLTFILGLYEGIKDLVNPVLDELEDDSPVFASLPYLVLAAAVLFLTILVSTARIVFRFYGFTMVRAPKGMHIRSGLTHVKERLVPVKKIQYLSWKASWLRRLLGIWLLEYHIAGSEELGEKKRVQVPVTRKELLQELAVPYHALPDTAGAVHVRMHRSFVMRRVVFMGIIPALVLAGSTFQTWGFDALYFLLLPLLPGIIAFQVQRRFRLWALEEVLYIRKGLFGEAYIVLQWHKLQSVRMVQSPYQRSRGLAALQFLTASGSIHAGFLPVEAARAIMNFAIYKTEVSAGSWH